MHFWVRALALLGGLLRQLRGILCGFTASAWLGTAEARTKLVTIGLSAMAISLVKVLAVRPFSAFPVRLLCRVSRQGLNDGNIADQIRRKVVAMLQVR